MNELDTRSQDKISFLDEINIFDIIKILRDGVKTLAVLSAIFFSISIIYVITIDDYYQSDSVLIPRDSKSSNPISELSGLASLAGIGISSGSDSIVEVMELITSRDFVKHLIKFDDVLPSIMAVKEYDDDSKKIVFNSNLYDGKKRMWEGNDKDNKKPSYLEAHRKYINMLTISEDNKTGLLNLSITHVSPIFAKEFLDLIIREANFLIRSKDIEASTEALKFLKQELARTQFLEIKDSINQLIEAQLETQMMAKIYEDYSIIAIEPPFVPDTKSGPKRMLIILFFTFLGLFIGILYLIIKFFVKEIP